MSAWQLLDILIQKPQLKEWECRRLSQPLVELAEFTQTCSHILLLDYCPNLVEETRFVAVNELHGESISTHQDVWLQWLSVFEQQTQGLPTLKILGIGPSCKKNGEYSSHCLERIERLACLFFENALQGDG